MIDDLISYTAFQELYIPKTATHPLLSMVKGHVKNEHANAVIVGIAFWGQTKTLCIQFNKSHRMGTIGVLEGETIALAFEYAVKKKLPVVAVVSSGGIRVEENTRALVQMVKMCAAVKQHNDKGLFYIAIIRNPTLGGTSASFVSLADVIIAEEGATYGFSGKRIIERTTHELLPNDFQTAEYAKGHGMVDVVASKEEIKPLITKLLRIYTK